MSESKLAIARPQLSEFLKDPDAIRLFERLFTSGARVEAGEFGLASLLGLGGVVESGQNSNGTYIMFGDGTMICMGPWTRAVSGGYTVMVNLPVAYINLNYVVQITPQAGATVAFIVSAAEYWPAKTRSAFCVHATYTTDLVTFSTALVTGLWFTIGSWK